MIGKTAILPVLAAASTVALTLSGCESSGRHRIGWVGDAPPSGDSSSSSSGGASSSSGGGSSSSGGTGSSSGGVPGGSSGGLTGGNGLVGNLIVTAGNTVIGVAGKHDGLAQVVNGVVPKSGVLTGKVTAILERTGQTLVHIGEGTGGGGSGGLILDGVGGKLGALVALDLGKGKVIAAPEGSRALIGLNVLAQNPTTGKLATVSAASGNSLLALDVKGAGGSGGLLGGVLGTTQGVTGGLLGKPLEQSQGPAQGQSKSKGLLGGLLPGKKD